jgi:chorismate dehydratase
MKLHIGKIAYTNLFPIFYMLEKECDCSDYIFHEGVPSELNRKLREGTIDISPSSSIEFLRNPALYDIIEDHSIDSNGPVGSVLLFSKKPIESLDGETIHMTSQSDTSVVMLRIICSKFFGLSCRYEQTSDPIEKALKSHAACLLIGDDALVHALKWPELRIYDLGLLWTQFTGLPFTYALWLVRKDSVREKESLVRKFRTDLDRAKKHALTDLRGIARASSLNGILTEQGLVEYWQGISYNFSADHKKGFSLFRQYAEELGLLP